MPTRTPWGPAQASTKFGRGIIFYNTSSHGGFHVSKTLNEQMHPALVDRSGWYEEDTEYARVIVAFPTRFPASEVAKAMEHLKEFNPDAYEAFLGVTLEPGQSFAKDERAWQEAHKADLIVLAAWGDYSNGIEKGTVVVAARQGGRTYPVGEDRYFIVDAQEYEDRSRFGFVIDPARHTEREPYLQGKY